MYSSLLNALEIRVLKYGNSVNVIDHSALLFYITVQPCTKACCNIFYYIILISNKLF